MGAMMLASALTSLLTIVISWLAHWPIAPPNDVTIGAIVSLLIMAAMASTMLWRSAHPPRMAEISKIRG